MSFKNISYMELWQTFCSAERSHLCKCRRVYNEEQFCDIILNLDQMPFKILLIWSSGGPFGHRSATICEILVEGIKKDNSVK